MSAIRVHITFVDGGAVEHQVDPEIVLRHAVLVERGLIGKKLVHELWSDDLGAPPRTFRISGTMPDGRMVDIPIAYV